MIRRPPRSPLFPYPTLSRSIHTRHMPLQQDVDLEKLASVSHGFVGADLEYLCKEAAMKTLRRMLPELKLRSEEHTSELQSQSNLVCRLLLERNKDGCSLSSV